MDVAVKLDHPPRAGAGVEPIDVLGHERELGDEALETGERAMAGVRRGLRNQAASPLVPVQRFGSRRNAAAVASLLGPEPGPEAVCASRKVGMPLWAEIPAPVRATTRRAPRNFCTSRGSKSPLMPAR